MPEKITPGDMYSVVRRHHSSEFNRKLDLGSHKGDIGAKDYESSRQKAHIQPGEAHRV